MVAELVAGALVKTVVEQNHARARLSLLDQNVSGMRVTVDEPKLEDHLRVHFGHARHRVVDRNTRCL